MLIKRPGDAGGETVSHFDAPAKRFRGTSEALVVGVPGAAGSVLSTSGGAFVIGAGFDAVGQYAQNGKVELEKSLVAGTTAAVGAKVLLRTPRQWAIYAAPTVGAAAAATNTTFNNAYYDESTNVWLAAGYGGVFSAAGPLAGRYVQKRTTPFITSTPHIPITGSAYIPSTPARLPTVPSYVGSGVNNTVSNLPSFISLDNGKSQQGVNHDAAFHGEVGCRSPSTYCIHGTNVQR
jgi:hypothetical protein